MDAEQCDCCSARLGCPLLAAIDRAEYRPLFSHCCSDVDIAEVYGAKMLSCSLYLRRPGSATIVGADDGAEKAHGDTCPVDCHRYRIDRAEREDDPRFPCHSSIGCPEYIVAGGYERIVRIEKVDVRSEERRVGKEGRE